MLTVGHGTLAAEDFLALVRAASIEMVVDVRRFPGSRRHPQFRREAMERWLPEAGVTYRWREALGGRRPVDPGSPHTALRNDSFRGYADHMGSGEFQAALDELLSLAGTGTTAVMCAESVWWRCHRRLIADALVLAGATVVDHLMPDGRLRPHRPTDGVRLDGDRLVYDVGAPAPLPLEEPHADRPGHR